MKIQNKVISTLAVLSMSLSSFVSVYAAIPTATTTITNGTNTSSESITIAAGDVVTVKTTFDSLVGYSGYQYEVHSDATAFSAVEGDNTNYNFGTAKKPVYLPNYMLEELISSRMEEMHVTLLIDDFKYAFNNGVGSIMGASSEGYAIKASDEAADMYPDNALGINFVANNDIKAGKYKFEIIVKVAKPDGSTDVLDTQTVTAVVEGSSEPTDPKGTVIAEIDGKQAVYSGSVDGTQIQGTTKFRITYNGSTEALKANGTTKDIMRNANQILDGVIGEGATLSGKLHFGVLIDPAYVETDGNQFTVEAIN